jgi:hypothetical protein
LLQGRGVKKMKKLTKDSIADVARCCFRLTHGKTFLIEKKVPVSYKQLGKCSGVENISGAVEAINKSKIFSMVFYDSGK